LFRAIGSIASLSAGFGMMTGVARRAAPAEAS
jgi:hypothetical protein